jgi:hypothetical protein
VHGFKQLLAYVFQSGLPTATLILIYRAPTPPSPSIISLSLSISLHHLLLPLPPSSPSPSIISLSLSLLSLFTLHHPFHVKPHRFDRYVLPQVIAMGFPAEGKEALYARMNHHQQDR